MFLHGFGEDGVTSGDIIEDMHGKRYAVGVWAKASNGYYLKGQKEKSIFCKNDVEMTKAAKKLKLWFCLEFGLKVNLSEVFSSEQCDILKKHDIQTINEVCGNHEQYIDAMFCFGLKSIVVKNDFYEKMKDYDLSFRT
jgi:hypothetical protein